MDSLPPTLWPPFAERWILPYVRIPALFPVVLAIVGHVVVFAALLVLNTWRDRNPFAAAGLLLLVAGTVRVVVAEWRRLRRTGPLVTWLLAAWALTGGLVALALRFPFI
jgi:hypothetical protein